MMPVLEVRDVTRRYRIGDVDVHALRGVTHARGQLGAIRCSVRGQAQAVPARNIPRRSEARPDEEIGRPRLVISSGKRDIARLDDALPVR
jgi:hypothetical protein